MVPWWLMDPRKSSKIIKHQPDPGKCYLNIVRILKVKKEWYGKKHGFLQHCNMPAEFVGQLLELVIGSAQEVAEQEKKGRAPNSGTGRSATTRCQMFTKDTKDITSARVF
jgi:hypothetical protein